MSPSIIASFGLSPGSTPCVFYASVGDMFHGRHYGKIIGVMVLGFALGSTLSPWLAGHLYDTSGSYTGTFLLLIGSLLATAALIRVVAPGKLSPVARPR